MDTVGSKSLGPLMKRPDILHYLIFNTALLTNYILNYILKHEFPLALMAAALKLHKFHRF